jgi:DNA-binding NtrC family response regulator
MSTSPHSQAILVVEDSVTSREMAVLLLEEAGYGVVACASAEEAMQAMQQREFGLLILDQNLPGMSGLQMLSQARKTHPDLPAVFIAGSLDLNLAVRISQERVAGIFTKPVDPRILLRKVAEVLHVAPTEDRRTNEETAAPRVASATPFLDPPSSEATPRTGRAGARSITDACAAYGTLGQRLKKVADFRSTLLLQGPFGAPFSALSRSLVAQSAFADGPFMECSPDQFDTDTLLQVLAALLVTEHAGTLLLTHIEDFNSEQIALLEQLLRCRGPFMPFAQRFRMIIGATPRLAQLAEEGGFDENLYYRLSALLVNVPALAEMRSDVVPLARYFLEVEQQRDLAGSPIMISPAAATWLEARDWPGDCAELQRVVLAASRHQVGSELGVQALEIATGTRASGPATLLARLPATAANPHSPPPILVLDDSPTPRETIELALRNAGYETIAHESGEIALQDLKARRFGLLVLDHELPGMSGVDFLTAARTYQPDVPAVFVAGSLNLNVAAQITRLGVSSIFTKPVDLRVLLAKINEIIGPPPARSRPAPPVGAPALRAPASAPRPGLASPQVSPPPAPPLKAIPPAAKPAPAPVPAPAPLTPAAARPAASAAPPPAPSTPPATPPAPASPPSPGAPARVRPHLKPRPELPPLPTSALAALNPQYEPPRPRTGTTAPPFVVTTPPFPTKTVPPFTATTATPAAIAPTPTIAPSNPVVARSAPATEPTRPPFNLDPEPAVPSAAPPTRVAPSTVTAAAVPLPAASPPAPTETSRPPFPPPAPRVEPVASTPTIPSRIKPLPAAAPLPVVSTPPPSEVTAPLAPPPPIAIDTPAAPVTPAASTHVAPVAPPAPPPAPAPAPAPVPIVDSTPLPPAPKPPPPPPRPIVRRPPGAYDFNSRLKAVLDKQPAPPNRP